MSSLALGPLSITVVQTSLNQGKRSAYLMSLGGMLVEVGFCLLALFGLHIILGDSADIPDNDTLLHDLYPVTIPILLTMGIVAIVNRNKIRDPKRKRGAHGPLLLGATLCLSNPMLLGFWLWVTAMLKSLRYLGNTQADSLSFASGVAVGIVVFFYSIIYVASRSHRTMSPLWRARVNMLFGAFFIGFALYLAVRFFFLED